MGAAFFFCEFGTSVLNPGYLDWQIQDDPAQHYLGWAFFRHEGWHFPLGKIIGYGAPEGSSVVYTDSIPLFALLFKTIRAVLPEPFQYTGLWMLVCYVLQGFFGWLLASLITRGARPSALISGLFVMSPAMLDRAVGHHALMGHWVVLFALYLALQKKAAFELRHPRMSWHAAWTLVIVLSALSHVYLHVMVLFLYAGAMVSFLHRCRWRGARSYRAAVVPAIFAPLTLYLEGAFVVRAADWAPTNGGFFGHFSMNLLSPFVPGFSGSAHETAFVSYFLPSQKWRLPGQLFEGFNYLGLGLWLLVATALVAKVTLGARNIVSRGSVDWRCVSRPWIPYPVLAAALAMAVFALSNNIMFGDSQLAAVHLSPRALRYAEIFRSSGRFFWPMGYVLLWWALKSLNESIRKGDVAFGLLMLAVAVQALDLSQFFVHHALPFRAQQRYTSPLRSRFWPKAVEKYRQVLFYPPSDISYYVPLGLVAAPAGATINVAYKARDSDALPQHAQVLRGELSSGQLRADALYVFRDRSVFERLQSSPAPRVPLLSEVDGLFVAGRLPIDGF